MNILITGVGGPTPIGIAKALRNTGIQYRLIGVDGSKLAPGLYNRTLFDNTYKIPNANDKGYWEAIEEIIKKEQINYAFPIPETEVLKWAEKQEKDGLPCSALIPENRIAKKLFDKFATYNFLKSTNLVPKSIQINTESSAKEIGTELQYPYWIRGGSGAGAVGSFKVNHEEDLKKWLAINPSIEDFIASEYLPGRNYACKVLFKSGQLVKAATGERIDYLLSSAAPSGISGMCAHGKLTNHPELIELSQKAINIIFDHFETKPHGFYTVDFREDAQGNPKITEINIRNVSFTLAFALGGANFAKLMLDFCFNPEKLNDGKVHLKFDQEYHFIRGVDSELFIIPENELL